MNAATVWGCIGIGLVSAGAGFVGGIFAGKAIAQKRCNAEIDSVKEAYQKYWKSEKKQDTAESVKAEEVSNVKETPKTDEKHPYKILTKEKAIEIANAEEIDVEEMVVNDQGHSLYLPDEILTTKLGMEPRDVAEILKSTGEHIFVKNNIDGKLYEVFSPEPF